MDPDAAGLEDAQVDEIDLAHRKRWIDGPLEAPAPR
jgi:hypothetical protein